MQGSRVSLTTLSGYSPLISPLASLYMERVEVDLGARQHPTTHHFSVRAELLLRALIIWSGILQLSRNVFELCGAELRSQRSCSLPVQMGKPSDHDVLDTPEIRGLLEDARSHGWSLEWSYRCWATMGR
jgi:hypothetical protein